MNISHLKKTIKKTKRLARAYTAIRNKYFNIFYSDERYLKYQYKKLHGIYPNLENPQNFSEKLIWLLLNYRDDKIVSCTDKYEVRDYYRKKLATEKYLIPCVNCYSNVSDINIDNLPDSFVLKATHGSGWNYLCVDKNKIKAKEWQRVLDDCNYWLTHSLFEYGREWNYEYIQPRIICESFICDEEGNPPMDYKFFCFGGEPKIIQLDIDRYGEHKRNFYNTNWELLNIEDAKIGYNIDQSKQYERPVKLNEMLQLAKKLSKDFPHVRVDFFYVEDKIFCGEMTFFHDAGVAKFKPAEFQLEMGTWLKLPKENISSWNYKKSLQ